MIYLIIALAVVAAGAGYLGWRLFHTSKALGLVEARCRSLQKERAQRENLQMILDSRNAENRRLRSRLRRLETDMSSMAQQTSELNLNLFHESSLRILREKEEGATRMKIDLMEKQLDELNRKLRLERQQARDNAARLNQVIEEQQQTIEEQRQSIEKLTAPQPRRAVRRRDSLPNQITLDEVLKS